MEPTAVVLMSTYCGSQYLKEQLDCIFQQTFRGNILILIRDDGSKDNTVELIRAYPSTPARQIQLLECVNVGPQRSFLDLIRKAPDADYYFFADQDDVWDPDKLEIACKAMEGVTPVCWCSNFRHTHMDLSVYQEKALAAKPKFTPLQIIFYNKIPGCVMGFDRGLMTLLKKLQLENVMMHDSMALALAAACGTVLYDDIPRISHRIHASNVVGHGHKKIRLHKWIPEKLKLLFGKEDYDLSKMAEQFLLVAGDRMDAQTQTDLKLLRDFKKCGKCKRKLLRHPDTQGRRWDRTVMSIRCKIRFKIF